MSVQVEAARSLADMARDPFRQWPDSAGHDMAINVRDEDEPVLQVRFIFAINKPQLQGLLVLRLRHREQ
jgi:hypothetical protein